MAADPAPQPEICTCLAVRQAARHITQIYDQHLIPVGLRTTQFSILAKLKQAGSMMINSLAAELVMDRTTLGRNILPLERDGLIEIVPGREDRRSKELRLTEAGIERLRAAVKCWKNAQKSFDEAFGATRATKFRAILRAAASTEVASAGGDVS
jgi:DNA-binding MarR family transcriptional regulator